MTIYKKENRLVGIFYGGQGFKDEFQPLTPWYDEDDPVFVQSEPEIRKQYDYFHKIEKWERYVKIK